MRRRRTLHRPLVALLSLSAGAASAAPATQTAEATATASAPATLTLAEAVERALGGYPAVAAARARAAEAAAATAEAEVSQGPIVKLNAVGLQYDDPMITSPIHSFVPADFPPFAETIVQGSLSVSYILVDSGASRQRSRQAEAQEAGAGAALQTTEQAIAARVATAYAGALARAEILAAEEARMAALTLELDRARQLFAAGKADEVETLRADAALAERAVAAGPAVEQARQQIAAAEAARALARSAYFPKVELVGAVQEFRESASDYATDWNAGVQLVVPIWDGGQTGRRVARAAAQRDSATAMLAQSELDAREAVDRAWISFADAGARAVALARAADRLAEVARVQKLLLEVGSGTQVDYLAAEAELAKTRAGATEARTAALLAQVELARLAGELSPA